jgi:hypothetical protein
MQRTSLAPVLSATLTLEYCCIILLTLLYLVTTSNQFCKPQILNK